MGATSFLYHTSGFVATGTVECAIDAVFPPCRRDYLPPTSSLPQAPVFSWSGVAKLSASG
jgi:hypothetical protein